MSNVCVVDNVSNVMLCDTISPAASVDSCLMNYSDDHVYCQSDCTDSLAASVYQDLDVYHIDSIPQHSLAASVYEDFVECSTNRNSQVSEHQVSPTTQTTDKKTSVRKEDRASSFSCRGIEGINGGSVAKGLQKDDCNQVRKNVVDETIGENCCINLNINHNVPLCPMSTRLHKSLISGVEAQLKPQSWLYYLQHEDNMEIRDYLWRGVSEGFDIVDRDVYIAPYE